MSDATRDRTLESMRGYARRKQELDAELERLIAPVLGDGETTILDAACGVGHLGPLLRALAPQCRYHGIDRVDWLIDEARALNAGDERASFAVGDVRDLSGAYDVVISWKVLSWLEDFEEMLPSLMGLTRRHLFVASLFYDGSIDFHTQVRESDGRVHHYNVYSLPRFRAAAHDLGARAVHAHPFAIGIDLPRGDPDLMGTYTERLENGRRLQFSGALAMPWQILRVDL